MPGPENGPNFSGEEPGGVSTGDEQDPSIEPQPEAEQPQDAQGRTPDSEPQPVDTNETKPEQPSWRDRLAERMQDFRDGRREKKAEAELRRNQERARERRIKGYAEIIKHGARSPQELQDLMADISFRDLKEAQDRIKYGGSAIGKLHAFMAGEHDFKINDDSNVKEYYSSLNSLRTELGREPNKQEHADRMGITPEQLDQILVIEDANTLTEAGRRLVSTFVNKRTAASAGMYLALGALTGGFGWAAGGVLLGGVAGRGVAEAGQLFSGKIREARENVLFAEKARWEKMQDLAIKIRASGEDAVTQGALTKELVELMYRQGENVLIRNLAENEKELHKREEKFEKIRNRLQTVGEIGGGIVGLTSILHGGVEHLDMDLWNKVDGQSIFHGVKQTADGSQFLYSGASEVLWAQSHHAALIPMSPGAHIAAGHVIGQFGHDLGASTAQLLGFTVAERILPMLIASQLAAGEHSTARETLVKMGMKRLDSECYYSKKDPKGERCLYTREEDGTYKQWKYVEVEKKDGDKTKKVRELVGEAVPEKNVPPKFVDRFRDREQGQNDRNAERLFKQMSEYIRNVADNNNNPIPENPRTFSYDWNEQPKVVDEIDFAKIDRWYKFARVPKLDASGEPMKDGKGNIAYEDKPEFNPETGQIVDVGVLGLDILNNRIAYVRKEGAGNGTEHYPVEIMRLDQFLKGFHLHLNSKDGEPVTPHIPGVHLKHDDPDSKDNDTHHDTEKRNDPTLNEEEYLRQVLAATEGISPDKLESLGLNHLVEKAKDKDGKAIERHIFNFLGENNRKKDAIMHDLSFDYDPETDTITNPDILAWTPDGESKDPKENLKKYIDFLKVFRTRLGRDDHDQTNRDNPNNPPPNEPTSPTNPDSEMGTPKGPDVEDGFLSSSKAADAATRQDPGERQRQILSTEGDELRKNGKNKKEHKKASNSETQPKVENRDDDRYAIVSSLYKDMPFVKKELLTEAGIQIFKTADYRDETDPSKDRERLTIILHEKNGEKGVLSISVLGGAPNIRLTEFTHLYPDDPNEKKLRHFKDPKLEVLDSFSNDLVERLQAASQKLENGVNDKSQQAVEEIKEAVEVAEEGNPQSEPVAKEIEENPVETLPEGFGVGSLFHFSEEFRNDPNSVDYRHDLANRIFPGIDENDRLAKLMDSDLIVTHLEPLEDNRYHLSYAVKKNGGQTEEEESLFLTPQEIGKLLKI